MTNKFGVVSSDTEKALLTKKALEKFLVLIDIADESSFKKPALVGGVESTSATNGRSLNDDTRNISAIIVIGGDGEMLHALHKFHHLNLPFIGINAGSVGFLMNENLDKEFFENLDEAEIIELHPLEMTSHSVDGATETKLAFNEVSIYRATNQATKVAIEINGKTQMEELIADGVLVATPAGSTAYNFSAGGRIVPLDSKLICLTPVCTFRPRRWHGAIVPDSTKIKFEVLEHEKRPVNAVADFNELKNIKSLEVVMKKEISARLLFSSHMGYSERMIKEQFSV